VWWHTQTFEAAAVVLLVAVTPMVVAAVMPVVIAPVTPVVVAVTPVIAVAVTPVVDAAITPVVAVVIVVATVDVPGLSLPAPSATADHTPRASSRPPAINMSARLIRSSPES
jgi:hypothetical protein